MKKLDTDALEKMAKQKNIDKDKIENIANNYKGKSENELIDELVKIGKTLEGKDEVISKFKTFLDDDQRKKLDMIMNKISDAEVQEKIESKKSKSKKVKQSPQNPSKSPSKSSAEPESTTSKKKVKKVVKKTKRTTSEN